jgi:ABC-2 type transport system permease protein
MPWSIFNETFRRGWQGMIYWGIGLAVLGLVIMIVIPNVAMLKQFENLMTTMPAVVKALGMEDAAQMATPEGLISAAYFGRVLLIMAVYAVVSGLNITANEEDAGIMDILLSLPLPRWRIILEKFAAYTLMSFVIVTIGFIGLYLGGITSAIHVDPGKLIISSINILPSLLLMLAFTMLAGTFFRHKNQAAAVSAFFIIGSYVVDFAGSAASESPIARLRVISFFAYYDNGHIMQNGLNGTYVSLLLGLTMILVIASVWCFERRDIGG